MRISRIRKNGVIQLIASTDSGETYGLPWQDFLNVMKEAEEREISLLELVEDSIRSGEAVVENQKNFEWLVPIEAPEVWAAGVTYEKSRQARNYESSGGKMDATTFYDKVYDAERPEIFFKSTAARTIGPGKEVHLRTDSHWQIPEPELGLVLSRTGKIVGLTIGNDMSCRDIEGENPLYLPQAKIWKNSCSIGPSIRLAETVENPYNLEIDCMIHRDGNTVFQGSANTRQLKRKLDEIVSYLMRDNIIFDGTVLLTGTCIVPPNDFSLANGDEIAISISGIGTLINKVKQQAGSFYTIS